MKQKITITTTTTTLIKITYTFRPTCVKLVAQSSLVLFSKSFSVKFSGSFRKSAAKYAPPPIPWRETL